jgi:uncharacterized phage-associated protein
VNSVFDVAKYIIEHEAKLRRPLKGVKLQKLLYYAQVYSVLLRREKLFDATFFAWNHGPAIAIVEGQHQYHTIPETFPGNAAGVTEGEEVLRLMLSRLGPLTVENVIDSSHAELPWKVASEQAKQLGMVGANRSWKTEMEVNMMEHVKRGYRAQGTMILPVALPKNIDIVAYSNMLSILADEDRVEEYAEELAETKFILLTHITEHVPFEEYSKACLVESVSNHWTTNRKAAKSALIAALGDKAELVQERAFKGLMRFYRAGDPAVRTLLDTRPMEEYSPFVIPTVNNLLKHA